MRKGNSWLALLLIGVLWFAPALADKQITFTFVGDCTVGCEDRLLFQDNSFAAYVNQYGYAYFLAKMKDFFSQDDLTVGNFEGVLKTNASGAANKTYCFRGLPDYAKILTLGGIDAVSLANNHTGDYGAKGRRSTLKALATAGVKPFGNGETFLYQKDGVTVAFCGFWGVGFNKRDDIAAYIRKLKADGADAVVCALHFGEEYATSHSKVQTEVARMVIDAGADLVVGHHPHVVQGMEVYQNRTIFYSLGNFLFGGNVLVRANECLVPRVTLRFSDDGQYLGQQTNLYPANISGDPVNNDYQPRLVTGEAAQSVFGLMDADSADTEGEYTQSDSSRTYAFLPASEP